MSSIGNSVERGVNLTASLISIGIFAATILTSIHASSSQSAQTLPDLTSIRSQVSSFPLRVLIFLCLGTCSATTGAFWSTWSIKQNANWSIALTLVVASISAWSVATLFQSLVIQHAHLAPAGKDGPTPDEAGSFIGVGALYIGYFFVSGLALEMFDETVDLPRRWRESTEYSLRRDQSITYEQMLGVMMFIFTIFLVAVYV